MYIVTRAHFQSHDKHGEHITRSAVVEIPTLHTNFMAVCFIELKVLTSKDCGKRYFRRFICSRDFDLDLMTFM